MTDERGLSQSLQWTLLTPVLVLALLGSTQVAVHQRGQSVARSAAMAGARAGAAHLGGHADAEQQARLVAEQAGLSSIAVSVTTHGGLVDVTVDASTDVFLDIGQGRVRGRAVLPKEQP